MLRTISPRDFILHTATGEYHKVLDVDEIYGWFKTENMHTRKVRIYSMSVKGNSSFTQLAVEEDLYLQLARLKNSRGDR